MTWELLLDGSAVRRILRALTGGASVRRRQPGASNARPRVSEEKASASQAVMPGCSVCRRLRWGASPDRRGLYQWEPAVAVLSNGLWQPLRVKRADAGRGWTIAHLRGETYTISGDDRRRSSRALRSTRVDAQPAVAAAAKAASQNTRLIGR